MNILIYCILFFFLTISPTLANYSQSCVNINKVEISHLFDRWNQSLQTGDPAKVSANYSHDAVLLPTLSSKVRATDAERRDYFKGFLKKKPVAKIDRRIIRIGCNYAIDSGTYKIAFKDGSIVPARYTFTYGWNGHEWLITSHHSSVYPKDDH